MTWYQRHGLGLGLDSSNSPTIQLFFPWDPSCSRTTHHCLVRLCPCSPSPRFTRTIRAFLSIPSTRLLPCSSRDSSPRRLRGPRCRMCSPFPSRGPQFSSHHPCSPSSRLRPRPHSHGLPSHGLLPVAPACATPSAPGHVNLSSSSVEVVLCFGQ